MLKPPEPHTGHAPVPFNQSKHISFFTHVWYISCAYPQCMSPLILLDVKTLKCLSLGMAQGSTKKSRNKKMAYTHHNDAMTSAHNTIQHLWCISHGIVMMSVSHFLVSRLFGASLSHS